MRIVSKLLLAIALCLGSPAAFAQSKSIAGQVVKVDQSANKITLKHGAIPQLDMDEGMTMVWHVQDAAILKGLKAGDKVNFDAERVNGQLTVTRIEKAR